MAIFELKADQIVRIEETTFGSSKFRERQDLQRLLRTQIGMIAPDTLIIAEEFGDWEDCRRRIDLLGVDKDANLVVFELKRTEDGGHMELQAIRYAAMVSTMTFDKAVELYERFLARSGESEHARAQILTFLGWDEPNEDGFGQDVRIVLVSADFSKELTTAVMWLNDRDLDIRCIRIKPYKDGDRLLVDVQQVIPLPEAAEYQVQIREKEQKIRQENSAERYVLRRKFWEKLLPRAEQKTGLHSNMSPGTGNYVGAPTGVKGFRYNYYVYEHGSAVVLYVDLGADEAETNKMFFDQLQSRRLDIEKRFGESLQWDRMDHARACSIRFEFTDGGWKDDQALWPSIQDRLIDAMVRLDTAFKPHLGTLKLPGIA